MSRGLDEAAKARHMRDELGYEGQAVLDYLVDRFIERRVGFVKRWLNRRVSIHLHRLNVRAAQTLGFGGRKLESGYFCARLEQAEDKRGPDHQAAAFNAEDSPRGRGRPGDDERPMLITVREPLKNGELVPRRVGAVVRLIALNTCHRQLGYPRDPSHQIRDGSLVPPPVKFGFVNRPFDGFGIREPLGGVLLDHEVSQMIEGGAQAVEALSDQDCKPRRGWIPKLAAEDKFSPVGVKLSDNAIHITFPKEVELSFSRCQVFLCPDDFGPMAFRGSAHD